MRAWVNGKVLDDPTGPAVAVSDHGLTVGDGVFEAIKAVEGRPFALGRHLERLTQSADGAGAAGARPRGGTPRRGGRARGARPTR